jgi:hypothetical protein
MPLSPLTRPQRCDQLGARERLREVDVRLVVQSLRSGCTHGRNTRRRLQGSSVAMQQPIGGPQQTQVTEECVEDSLVELD